MSKKFSPGLSAYMPSPTPGALADQAILNERNEFGAQLDAATAELAELRDLLAQAVNDRDRIASERDAALEARASSVAVPRELMVQLRAALHWAPDKECDPLIAALDALGVK